MDTAHIDPEATIDGLIPYVLTDGCLVAEIRWLTSVEFEIANERALIATGSAWEWVPYQQGDHGHWSKHV